MNNHKCPACNVTIAEGVKFCTKCGNPVNYATDQELCSCGNLMANNLKFCTSCGAPNPFLTDKPTEKKTINPVPTHNKSIENNAARKDIIISKGSYDKEPDVKKKTYILIAVAMIIILTGLWYLLNPDFFGRSNKSGAKSQNLVIEERVSTENSPITISSGDTLTLNLPLGLFEGEKWLKVKKVPDMNSNRFKVVYEITLDDSRKFDNYIEIIVLCTGSVSGGKLQAWHFSETGGEWEPVPTWSGPEEGSIRIYTDHLSMFAFGESEIPETEPVPEAIVGPELPAMGNLSAPENLHQILNMFNQGDLTKLSSPCSEMIFRSFGIHSSYNRGNYDPWRSSLIVTDPFSYLLAASLSGISDENLKESQYRQHAISALGNYKKLPSKVKENQSVNDVFTALFAFDYAENHTNNTTYKSKYALDDTYHVFVTTSTSGGKRPLAQWKQQLRAGLMQLKDPSMFGQLTDQFIRDQFMDFIERNGNKKVVYEKLKELGETVSDNLDDLDLSGVSADFYGFLRHFLRPVINDIRKDYVVGARVNLQNDAEQIRQDLNKRHHIHCKMKLNAVQKTVNYAGSIVVFDVPEAYRPKWQGVLDANETLDFYFTSAGYIEAGMPTRATLYLNQKNEKEIITVDFQLNSGTTELVFTPDDFSPVFGGKKVDINRELQKQQDELEKIYKQLNR